MKFSTNLLILVIALLVLVFNFAFTGDMNFFRFFFKSIFIRNNNLDAAALTNDDSLIESAASDEYDGTLRNKKSTDVSTMQHFFQAPFRRPHLRFGVLGKRYSYGYLGRRSDGIIN